MGKSKKSKKDAISLDTKSGYIKNKSKSYSESSDKEYAKRRKKKRRSYSSSSSEERHKQKKKAKRRVSSSNCESESSSESSEEEYIKRNKNKKYCSSDEEITKKKYKDSRPEEESENTNKKITEKSGSLNSQREGWMSIESKFSTFSNSDRKRERDDKRRLEREKQQYNPSTCDRELNPYWKDGGDGLPKFKKPTCDSDDEKPNYKSSNRYNKQSSNWRKKKDKLDEEKSVEESSRVTFSSTNKKETFETNQPVEYTEKDLNAIAAKILKAEIMGNTKLIIELKEKLENAKKSVELSSKAGEEYILTHTDSKGQSVPLKPQSEYGETSNNRRKKKTETHQNKERVRYFPDDDKYSLKQMFENEKYTSQADQDKQFLKSLSKIRHNDDLDDVFSDNIRHKESESKVDEKNKSKAISDHQKITKTLDNCFRCIQSESMLKHLMLSMGSTAYLSLPPFEPLVEGHCMISPIRHAPCGTQLDENEWSDILDVRKALVKMFHAENKTVIFFECAKGSHKYPHMVIECIPIPKEEGDMAPIYFKKAIDESEMEWTQNKKLVSLKGRDVRKAIPKGLLYFCVSFGMEEGFAHVIEDERLFPMNFAQEIVGGMLDLDHSKWRKPKNQSFEIQSKRVLEFSVKWKGFDCWNSY